MTTTRGRSSVTLADVAALAGVSTSTASLAFRTTGSITERMRQRILTAARELDYAGPNPTARSLKSGRSGIVGVVVAESIRRAFQSPVTIATMDGLSEALDALDVGQLLLPGRSEQSGRSARLLDGMPVDAVVFLTRGEEFDSLLPGLRARRIPLVGIEGPHEEGIALVDIDDARGTRDVARHVRSLGHARVAVVMRTTRLGESLPPGEVLPVAHGLETIANRTIRERLRATAAVFPDAVRVEAGGRDLEAGEIAAGRLLDLPAPPTAILAQNDMLAAGVLRAAAVRAIPVPGRLTVTGFDGADLPWLDRRLTTVEQPLHDRGLVAGRMVGDLLAGRTPADVVLPVTLRVGDTSGPPGR
ncbi:HTH-type transcriptional regulator DegA [Frondihabitans sp. 762G35]|uniref:LacI family DNA-binding transcriptional regulator n=1 Tax=Frondihabitans sp. 762G35 TaxID=1446794 RepID=UPI000D212D0F|nr:LacI family DNA-binding transcriptional regulator [Frondihabitans sp. 762G35]ARC57747.1 HTH-type transcriptional regulator DegA [Frondihabitans sp. 762G35]